MFFFTILWFCILCFHHQIIKFKNRKNPIRVCQTYIWNIFMATPWILNLNLLQILHITCRRNKHYSTITSICRIHSMIRCAQKCCLAFYFLCTRSLRSRHDRISTNKHRINFTPLCWLLLCMSKPHVFFYWFAWIWTQNRRTQTNCA